MKTDRISHQNFNGKLIYVSNDGIRHFNGIEKRLPYAYCEYRNLLKEALAREPFDVFISRGERPLLFKIKASGGKGLETITREVELKPVKENLYRVSEYYENVDDIENAIYDSIEDYNMGIYSKVR